jgi:2-succinyl-6-hydroxy-2,4-cyclohexadiene-1-carboxylate synthase
VKTTLIALHGFLGRGSDWDLVRAASKSALDWQCPDLFSSGASSFDAPVTDRPCWLAGYSFGARLALRWMQEAPDRYLGALLVSANPGNFQTDDERTARRMADKMWADKFRHQSWNEVLGEWNTQQVFAPDSAPLRDENDFDREKLAAALEEFSVAAQFTDPLRLPSRLIWLAGARDGKFCALLDDMRNTGFPGTFLRVDDAGHRLLHAAPGAVAAALDDLVA